jgi:hypothetical protein
LYQHDSGIERLTGRGGAVSEPMEYGTAAIIKVEHHLVSLTDRLRVLAGHSWKARALMVPRVPWSEGKTTGWEVNQRLSSAHLDQLVFACLLKLSRWD